MNILTFDIEEWALAKAGGYGTSAKYAEYDKFLDGILGMLDARGLKATFFCTGLMAQEFSRVVRLIQGRGHEIGCHSHRHTWMNKMTETEAREDTHAAVFALEQCVGQKVISYRAPAFSISKKNKWMFEILAENGIENDSSVYPAARDFGGFPNFSFQEPCIVKYSGVEMKEYPIRMTRLLGKEMAFSGGGYFRLFPLSYVKRMISNSKYTMCYFHIEDLLPEKGGVPSKERYESYFKEPGTFRNRYIRYIKSNIGKKGAWNKLEELIRTEEFMNIDKANMMLNWDEVPHFVLSDADTIGINWGG